MVSCSYLCLINMENERAEYITGRLKSTFHNEVLTTPQWNETTSTHCRPTGSVPFCLPLTTISYSWKNLQFAKLPWLHFVKQFSQMFSFVSELDKYCWHNLPFKARTKWDMRWDKDTHFERIWLGSPKESLLSCRQLEDVELLLTVERVLLTGLALLYLSNTWYVQ